jgi:hypothetical protein
LWHGVAVQNATKDKTYKTALQTLYANSVETDSQLTAETQHLLQNRHAARQLHARCREVKLTGVRSNCRRVCAELMSRRGTYTRHAVFYNRHAVAQGGARSGYLRFSGDNVALGQGFPVLVLLYCRSVPSSTTILLPER